MKVIDIANAPSADTQGGIFTGGTVNTRTLIDSDMGALETRAAIVTFAPGARTKMHTHDHEQILYILTGEGIVANEEKEYVATPGKIFLIPAGERHWHGATAQSSFSHLYVLNSETETKY